MQNTVHIREAEIIDIPSILSLLRELVQTDEPCQFIDNYGTSLLEHGFGTAPRFKVLLAEIEGQAVGFLRYTCDPSNSETSRFISLEDLIVARVAYRRGVAQALLQQIDEIRRSYQDRSPHRSNQSPPSTGWEDALRSKN